SDSAVVTAAGEHAAALAREQLLEVCLGDLVEVEVQLARQLGDVPEHVAELLCHRLPPLAAEDAAVVPDRLLGVLGDLPGLPGEAERRVCEPGLARILGGAAREPLILGDLHVSDRMLPVAWRRLRSCTLRGSSQNGASDPGGAAGAEMGPPPHARVDR